jgi:hypothetical protein
MIAELTVPGRFRVAVRNIIGSGRAESAEDVALIVYIESDYYLPLSSMAPDLKRVFAGLAPG